jgi:hypothetical protein
MLTVSTVWPTKMVIVSLSLLADEQMKATIGKKNICSISMDATQTESIISTTV